MSQPLSPLESSALNRRSPPTAGQTHDTFPQTEGIGRRSLRHDIYEDELDGPPSSPFIADVDQENPSSRNAESPNKHCSPTKYSSTKSSPQKQSPLKRETDGSITEEVSDMDVALATRLSPAKHSPKKHTPIKQVNAAPLTGATSSAKNESSTQPLSAKRGRLDHSPAEREHYIPLTAETLRDNEGLTRAIQSMEDTAEDSVIKYYSQGDDTVMTNIEGRSGFPGMDDTCFSAFSAVPNTDMALFAHIGDEGATGRSPTKSHRSGHVSDPYDGVVCAQQPKLRRVTKPNTEQTPTPRRAVLSTPTTARRRQYEDSSLSPSPTPRRRQQTSRTEDGDTMNLIVDFTEQFNSIANSSHGSSPSRCDARPSASKSKTISDLASYTAKARTPSPTKRTKFGLSTPGEARHLANLLDFDIPPAPTPRSVPSITPRELESLKSGYLSQLSSMRATISGRDAEVASLKSDVQDAEKRVGETMEIVREERGAKDGLLAEKADWETRGKEMEDVLSNMKEELARVQAEKEHLERRLEASERGKEEAEAKKIEFEGRLAGISASGSLTGSSTASESGASSTGSGREVEAAVEKVARELHALYKEKHETKVGALKKSYQSRWEKKVKDLEAKLEDARIGNEELRMGRDATFSGPVSTPLEGQGCMTPKASRVRAEPISDEQKAQLDLLAKELEGIKTKNSTLQRDLDRERAEKGDLVAAVEEMLAMQAGSSPSSDTSSMVSTGTTLVNAGDDAAQHNALRLDNLRGSISRASGLRGPGFWANGESRIVRMPVPRSGSGGAGGNASGALGRSGIMSNIERMGRARGAGVE
ncbi:MAG: hypothetical protein M1836_002241 [Candelina mexicana]|nr:MAG: hypothetical protein M1836_002241 [Candelina mexicana]